MLLRCPGKEPLGGRDVPPSAQAKIHGAARFIRGAIEVDPLAFNFRFGSDWATGYSIVKFVPFWQKIHLALSAAGI